MVSSHLDLIHNSDVDKYFMRVVMSDRKTLHRFHFLMIYGATQGRDKEFFLANLSDLCINKNLPLFIGVFLISIDFVVTRIKL